MQEEVISVDSMVSLGFRSKSWTLFRTFQDGIVKSPFRGQVGAVWFMMSFDKTEYTRTIYGFFDWLGDVGGLNDMLYLVGGQVFAFISFLTGSGLNRFLI